MLAEVLASQPDPPASKPPGHGFTPLIHKLTNIEDLLIKVIYATAHMDPSDAPESERPTPLYLEMRKQIRKRSMSRLLSNFD